MEGDLTAKPGTPEAELTTDAAAPPGALQAVPTTGAAAPPGTEPRPPNPNPSLSQLAANWRVREFIEQVLAAPEVPASITEAEAIALSEPATGPDTSSAAGPETLPATPETAMAGPGTPPATPKDAAPLADTRHAALRKTGEGWLEWVLPVLAIALPAFFLILIPFIRKNIMTWGEVDLSAQRGEYLIPVLILCAETVRRWCLDVKCRGRLMRAARFAAVSVCAIALVICFVGAVVAVEYDPTPASSRSIVTITAWCLIPSFVFGTCAVMLSQREHNK